MDNFESSINSCVELIETIKKNITNDVTQISELWKGPCNNKFVSNINDNNIVYDNIFNNFNILLTIVPLLKRIEQIDTEKLGLVEDEGDLLKTLLEEKDRIVKEIKIILSNITDLFTNGLSKNTLGDSLIDTYFKSFKNILNQNININTNQTSNTIRQGDTLTKIDNKEQKEINNKNENANETSTLGSEELNIKEYNSIYVNSDKYISCPEKGFVITTDNKKYTVSESDRELLIAIVAAESDKSSDDALATISVILNRCEDSEKVRQYGSTPIEQATAKGQFVVYQGGEYKKYMNYNVKQEVIDAVDDALNGIRNNDYLYFKSNRSSHGYSITSTGNKYDTR